MVLCGSGAWKSFDDLEDNLILDELLMLMETIDRESYEEFRKQALLQGAELEPYPEKDQDDQGDDGLPEELIEAERRYQERKRKYEEDGKTDFNELEGFGIGKG